MEFLYFDKSSEKLVRFTEPEIKEETFCADILRIGALKNGINPAELYSKLNEDELDYMMYKIECEPSVLFQEFFIKDNSNNEFYLTIKDHLIEKVNIIGKNEHNTMVKIVGSVHGILIASNLYINKNLVSA